MPKWSQSRRLLRLMQQLEWRGRNDWEEVRNRREAEKYLPEFMEWVQDTVDYLPVGIKEDFIGYYFENTTGKIGDGYYYRLEQARAALQALYIAQKEGRHAEVVAELWEWYGQNPDFAGAAMFGYSLGLPDASFFPLILELLSDEKSSVALRYRFVCEAFKRDIPEYLRDNLLEHMETLSKEFRTNG